MLLTLLQEGQQDPLKAEVAFFGARSLLDGFDEDELDKASLGFLKQLVDYFFNNP